MSLHPLASDSEVSGITRKEGMPGGIEDSGDVSLDCSIVISVNSDSNHRRTVTCRRCKIINYFISSPDELDHLWSSCRNLNDNSSNKDLFDKPFVWSVTQLVLTMDQVLIDPGIKQQPL